jgi:mono/diheme cytochrome c family protein
MKVFLALVLGVIVLGIAAGWLGLFNPAASVPPTAIETHAARFFLDRSVARRAPKNPSPLKADAQVRHDGLAHYKAMCLVCHGAPGIDASEIAEGLNPPAPDLTLGRVQKRTDGEIFWIVQNGIRMTGMPAFGTTHKDEEIWKIVAFVRRLPALSPDDEKELKVVDSAQ